MARQTSVPKPAVWARRSILDSVEFVGKFVTRVRPGDEELWDRLVQEARCLHEIGTPLSQAVSILIEIAGDNPRAFGGMGGKSTKGLSRTTDGQAVHQMLLAAAGEWANRRRVGVPKVWGRKRTSEEKDLAALPVAEGFRLLAHHEPRLLAVADEAIQIAATGRSAGQNDSSIRTSISNLFVRIVATDPIVGSQAIGQSKLPRLVTTAPATQVVWAHLAAIADVTRGDFG